MALDGGRGRHLRGDEVGAPAAALAALEVPVGGRGAPLAGGKHVRVHSQAHRAPGEPPFEAGVEEDLVEPFRLGLAPNVSRAGNDERRDARVLVAGANFGCGSSREHAPQALQRWGIRAIVAESFAEIFAGNALMIGLPCVTVAKKDAEAMRTAIDADAAAEIVVDLRAGRVTTGALDVEATMPEATRSALLSGHWDATGLLLENYEEVLRAAARIPYVSQFST